MSVEQDPGPRGRLVGKVVVITGTAGGQGRAAASLFAREGAVVVGADVKVNEAEETVAAVRAEGGTMSSLQPCDLSTSDGARRLIDHAVEQHGRIDVLFNNAGRPQFAPIAHLSDEQWRFTLANELDSVFYLCRAAWPHLQRSPGAAIVNTASLNAQRVVPGLPAAAHTAAKSGVMAFTRQLAIEGAPDGIRANSVSPGIIRTPATEAMLSDPQALEIANRSVLLGRLGEPEDVAHLALFLASDEASWITGADFLVDGGGAIF